MRLKVPMASANESLVGLVNRGYAVLTTIRGDYASKKRDGRYNKDLDIPQYEQQMNQWATELVDAFSIIFPTELEGTCSSIRISLLELSVGTTSTRVSFDVSVISFAAWRRYDRPRYLNIRICRFKSASEMLIKDVHGKVVEVRAQSKPANYLIMDGQDTARVLLTYGKL